jgi:hypothetical protein
MNEENDKFNYEVYNGNEHVLTSDKKIKILRSLGVSESSIKEMEEEISAEERPTTFFSYDSHRNVLTNHYYDNGGNLVVVNLESPSLEEMDKRLNDPEYRKRVEKEYLSESE